MRKLTPKPEYLSDARSAILGIVEQTRQEKGCRSFDIFEGEEPGHIYLFEEWDDQAALDAHYAQPYTTAVFEQYQQWLAQPPEIKKFSKLK